MKLAALKYAFVFLLPVTTALSFRGHGWICYLPLIYAFAVVPLLDYLIGEDKRNISDEDRAAVEKNPLFDLILYSTVFVQVAMLFWFFIAAGDSDATASDHVGRILSMGLMCGVFGVNVAHELGHRTKYFERVLAKVMLTTTLFLHFYIEHNRGHHRNVGTPQDAATARKGESLYRFWLRVVPSSFLSAWSIVRKERERRKLAVWSIGNELIAYVLVEIVLCVIIGFVFGGSVLIAFLCSALMGILLLETVNYIEHYGLFRTKVSEFRYEDVRPIHSWNADFVVGRLLLFELTRHSDHHWKPSKHYQVLDTMPESSHLPAGYPAMMLAALCPPLWFAVMNKRLPS